MALVWAGTATVRDAKGETAKIPFHLETPDITAIVDAADDPVEFAQELARLMDAVISGQIIGLKLTILVALPGGIKTAPLDNSDVEEGVTFMLRTTTGAPVRLRIATFDEAFITSEGELTSDTEVTDLVELMTIPEELPADWGIGLSDNRGTPVNRLFNAEENFKRSRRD